MKPDKSFDEIGDLLRSRKPGLPTPTGLETRILRTLEERRHPAPKSWWPWLLLPPAFAALVVVMWPRPAAPILEISRHVDPPTKDPALESVVFAVDEENPLTAETAALSRDAERAGSFLIGCLPSIASQGE